MKSTLIFNLKQSLFLIRQGIVPVDIGRAGNKVYHKFYRTEEFELAFEKWCKTGFKHI